MRRQLCDEHVAVENQAAHLEDAMLRRLSKRRLIRLEADIRVLDKRLAEMCKCCFRSALCAADLDARRRPVLAFTLIALLPELGKMSRKQIAASSVSHHMTSTVASSGDIAVSTVVGCRSVMSSTWRPSAQPYILPQGLLQSPRRRRQEIQSHHRRRHAKNDHNPQRYAPR